MLRTSLPLVHLANFTSPLNFLAPSFSCFPISLAHFISTLTVGTDFQLTRQFTASDVANFVALTDDANAIHTDSTAATAAGLSSPIVPGILMASLFPAIIGSNFPGAIYVSQTLKFRKYAEVGLRKLRFFSFLFFSKEIF